MKCKFLILCILRLGTTWYSHQVIDYILIYLKINAWLLRRKSLWMYLVVNSRQFWVKSDTVLRLMNTLARTINCGIFLALEYEKKIRQRDFFQRLCNVVCSFTVYSMVLIVQVNCLAMLPFAFAVRKRQKV